MRLLTCLLTAVGMTSLGYLARVIMISGDETPFITFYVPIAISGLLAGLQQALLSTLVAALFIWFVIIPPPFSFHASSAHMLELVLFLANGMIIGWASDYRQKLKRGV